MAKRMIVLRPYQDAALAFHADDDGAFWAMEMRLGKTIVCIRWLLSHPREPNIVAIIAPKTVLLSWEKELKGEDLDYYDVTEGSMAERRALLKSCRPGFYLINYEAVAKLGKELADFDAIVCDESTRIKNPGAAVTKTLLKLSKIVPVRACLSGLPNPEGWFDVWSQMAFVNGGSWMGYDKFWDWRDAMSKRYGFEYIIPPQKQALIRQAFHSGAFVLTRKQAGIKDTKIRQARSGTLPAASKCSYDAIVNKWEHPTQGKAKHAMVVTTWLRQFTGDPAQTPWKMEELLQIITQELPNDQIVVWFAYNQEIYNVWQALKPHQANATWITGKSTQEERRERINLFQSGQRRVLLIQMACGQYGLDLSAADTAIYYSSTYRYELRAQSEDRVFSVGKSRDLLIVDFITDDSVDEVVQESVAQKKSDASFLLAKLNLNPPKAQP